MKSKGFFRLSLLPVVLLLLLLAGCRPAERGPPTCTVVFEDHSGLFFSDQVHEVPRDGDLTVTVGVPTGRRISSVSFGRYTLSGKTGSTASYDYYTLVLHNLRYSAVVRLTTAPVRTTAYHLDGGPLTVREEGPHLYANTLAYRAEFAREGFLPVGWNTAADGSGTHVGFGSRAVHGDGQHLDLYPEWLPCTPAEAFSYRRSGDEIAITGCSGWGEALVIPGELGGGRVTAIDPGAFGDVEAGIVALPPSLRTVAPGAFRSLEAEHLYLFDGLEEVGEASFGRSRIHRLHVNALRAPVYTGSYFAAFADKADYLRSLEAEDKLVLFCGSSARFGYSSPMLEAAFPDYRVVNMGVYAYSNMLPQAGIVLRFMKAGDVLLSSPELDAIEEQFCGETDLDKETFCMMESNYDLLALLDCREFTNVFAAFADYQAARAALPPRTYDDTPAYYDEDGVRQEQLTYNRWGDYILYRENNTRRVSFGVKRAFYNADHIRPADWQGLNDLYDAFSAKGVAVYFTYSPRSAVSISPDSTPAAVAGLDALVRERLHARVISTAEASLMDPLYFFGTDNHLSTEGVALHTRKVADDLRRAMEGDP